MIINKISQNFNYSTYYPKNIKESKSFKYQNPVNSFPSFMGIRVNKGMERFYEFNKNRIPTTLKIYLESVPDMYALSPLEAQRKAFSKLQDAKNVKDVRSAEFFPKEELFLWLDSIENTRATTGLLGLYREFKELYENGILKSGEDFTVYLLKKIFIEAKTLNEINEDLEQDILPDIKSEFDMRYPNSPLLRGSTLKALGICLPDVSYQNSLKYTRDGYADSVGLKISEAQLKYWNSLTDEQKFDILTRRCEGRDNWWNSFSRDEKLELAANIDSEEELFKKYKYYVSTQKRLLKANQKQEFSLQKPKKGYKIGSNLNDKDIFALWMKKNLERFYASLSEADKDLVHIKRIRRLTSRWQEMSPEERTEFINKLRVAQEPLRLIMIDAWNKSKTLKKELSEFLKSKQMLMPADLLYSDKEFSEFQSNIMTEFWASHKDLAEEFGRNIKASRERIELAMNQGVFEDIRQEILRERAIQIKLIEHERHQEEYKKLQRTTVLNNQISETPISDYKEDFINAYKERMELKDVLPKVYVDTMLQVIIESMPKELLVEYTKSLKNNTTIPAHILAEIEKIQTKMYYPKISLMQRTLETAIAAELYAKGANPSVFSMTVDKLINILEAKMSQTGVPKRNQIDSKRIEKLFEEYRKNLTKDEASYISDNFFALKNKIPLGTENEMLSGYCESYGRTLLLLFSNQSAYPDEVKIQLNKKFLELMPEELSNAIVPLLNKPEHVIFEKEIKNITGQISRRFYFLPAEILNIYTKEIAANIRYGRMQKPIEPFVERIKSTLCKRSTKTDYQPVITIDKHTIPTKDKIKLLAIEKAMADELYSSIGDINVYGYEFEELANCIEILTFLKTGDRMQVQNGNKNDFITVKKMLNLKKLQLKYNEYLKELNNRSVFKTDNTPDADEIICALNPYYDKSEIDRFLEEKIAVYFPEK